MTKNSLIVPAVFDNKKFVDSTFPTSDAILWADFSFEANSKLKKFAYNTTWERAGEKYPDYTLWGPKGVNPNDVA